MSPQDALHVNLHRSHATNETSISATSDIRNQVYDHTLKGVSPTLPQLSRQIIPLESLQGASGAMQAVVPLVSSLPLELPLPNEGLDRPEFKLALTALLKPGFDGALEQHNDVVNQKIRELERKTNDIHTMIQEESERYARESSKLQFEIQALEGRFPLGQQL